MTALSDSPAPSVPTITVRFAGNLTTQPFGRLRKSLASVAQIAIEHADFGQVVQELQSTTHADFLVIHTDHRWFFDENPDAQSTERSAQFIGFAQDWLSRNRGNLILNTIATLPLSPIVAERLRARSGVARINETIREFALAESRVLVIDVEEILADIGYRAAIRERNRYVMQFPYTSAASAEILAAYAETIRLHYQARRKVIVVDADNTLWGGVIGEVGAKAIGVGDDFPQVQYKRFQQQLAELKRCGFLLAAVTKNNEDDFIEAFAENSMPLRLDDFIAWRANWEPKSENIVSIAEQLNVGLDALVFIDDNPFEIEEVASRAPGVEGHVFPKDDFEAVLALVPSIASLRGLRLTEEDQAKTEQYRAEAMRSTTKAGSASLEDYLGSLNIEIICSVNEPQHIPRIAQLTNKTNQFNLTTRRYSENAIRDFMANGKVYDFRVRDRFGDMGIVGVAIVADGSIDTFLLSCRALGRKVESEMLRVVTEDGAGSLRATYSPTAKNQQTAEFFDEHGFERLDDSGVDVFYRQVATIPASDLVRVINEPE